MVSLGVSFYLFILYTILVDIFIWLTRYWQSEVLFFFIAFRSHGRCWLPILLPENGFQNINFQEGSSSDPNRKRGNCLKKDWTFPLQLALCVTAEETISLILLTAIEMSESVKPNDLYFFYHFWWILTSWVKLGC